MILPERALKLLRLAMCDSTHKGERESAAIKFVEELKHEGITPEQFERKPPGKGFEHANRYEPAKGPLRHRTPSQAHTASDPLRKPSGPSPRTAKGDLEEMPEEELQWLYEKHRELPGRKRQMVINEMERRGLL